MGAIADVCARLWMIVDEIGAKVPNWSRRSNGATACWSAHLLESLNETESHRGVSVDGNIVGCSVRVAGRAVGIGIEILVSIDTICSS